METKSFLKSKTIRFLIIALVIVLTNILGIGEAEPGKTYDTMLEMEGEEVEQVKNLLMLIGLGGAGYGRVVAKQPLGRKKKNGK